MKNIAKALVHKGSIIGYRLITSLGCYDVSTEDVKTFGRVKYSGIVDMYSKGGRYISREEDDDSNYIGQIDNSGMLLETLMSLIDDSKLGFSITVGDSLYNIYDGDESNYNSRYCIKDVVSFLSKSTPKNFLVLNGLRRTGKTVLIKQAIDRLVSSGVSVDSIAFISIRGSGSLRSVALRDYVAVLLSEGIRYLFIDEVTFVEGSLGWLSGYTQTQEKFKIVLSGTYSARFLQVKSDSLLDRAYFLDTTYISFEEYNMLYKGRKLLDYISSGGILDGDKSYLVTHEYVNFASMSDNYTMYVSSSVVSNILNSFKNSDFGILFPELYDMYWEDENLLKTMVIRWLQNYSKDLTMGILNSNFKSPEGELLSSMFARSGKNLKLDLFLSRLYNRLEEEWGIKKYKYSRSSMSELRKLMSYLGILTERTYAGNVYLVPILLRVGCLKDVLNLVKSEYNYLIEGTGIAVDVNKVTDSVQSIFEGSFIESVFEVDLLKHGVECSKLEFDVGEVDLVIAGNYYELKRSNKFRKGYARWLLHKDVRGKGILNVAGNFEEGIVKLSEKEALKGCNKTEDVLKRLSSADDTLYDVHLKNLDSLLIDLTRGRKVLRISTIGGVADYRL